MKHFRNILPPTFVLWLFALGYSAILGFEFLIWALLSDAPENPIGRPRWGACVAAALVFGGYRALWNHPLVRPGYFAWLQATPWRFPDPLPAGPPHWVWQDGAIIATLVLLSLGVPGTDFYDPLIAFILGYTGCLCVASAATGIYWPTYATLFLFGLTGLLDSYSEGILQLVPLVATYFVGLQGLRQSLAAYPWERQFDEGEHRWQGTMGLSADARSRYTRKRAVGFPSAVIAPSQTDSGSPYRHGFAIAITAAWVTIVALSVCESVAERLDISRPLLMLAPFLAAMSRVLTYCMQYWPPISFLGRVLTLRWIIPGYDRVFLTPIATLVCGYAVTISARIGLINYDVAAPIVVFVSVAIAINGGPSLANWRLTGHHRIIAAGMALSDCKKV